jgi:hypothetical protein
MKQCTIIDSVVRGTTSKEIVQMAREAGAKKVYFASCAPPIRYPNVYGIDMPTSAELVAHNRSIEQVAAYIGADRLIYQRLEDLIESCRKFNQTIQAFDVSVFSGHYVTGDVSADYLSELEHSRGSSGAKSRQQLPATLLTLSRQPSFDNGCVSPANGPATEHLLDCDDRQTNAANHAVELLAERILSSTDSSSNQTSSYHGPDTETMGLYNSYGRNSL